MASYQFEVQEFAKLLYLLNRLVGFHHQERDEDELRQFSNEIFPLLREMTYRIVVSKLSERQDIAISKNDPWPPTDLTQAEAIALLTAVLSK